jgi:hypothetical protein
MSNYIKYAYHPKTGKLLPVAMLDNYFGHYEYGVKFFTRWAIAYTSRKPRGALEKIKKFLHLTKPDEVQWNVPLEGGCAYYPEKIVFESDNEVIDPAEAEMKEGRV